MTDREQLLDELRPASFAIAYRMLGSVSEAEDVVQEALLRVHQAIADADQLRTCHWLGGSNYQKRGELYEPYF